MDAITAPSPARAASAPRRAFERDYAAARLRARLTFLVSAGIFLTLFAWTTWFSGFFESRMVTLEDGSRGMRWVIAAGLDKLDDYIVDTIPRLRLESLGTDIATWFWRFETWMQLLLETMLIAFMATALGVFGGFVLSFPASRNLAPNMWVFQLCRRFLEVARTVPELVWALMFVFAFGVGPMAGVLAVGLGAAGALGKLYSEVNENIDMAPLDGVKAAGGDWFDQIRYGAVPQVMPNIISYTLLRFEINVRASTIIGYVGAGGLGQELRTAMTLQEHTDLSALFVIVFLTVLTIDYLSEKLRHRIIGLEERAP